MTNTIALIGGMVTVEVDTPDFYDTMLGAIADKVFQLLGPQFDKKAYLKEVEKGRSPEEIGRGWAVPVAISLSLELGYCLGQLRCLGKCIDCDKALEDLYGLWKKKLTLMIREEAFNRDLLH